MQLQLGRPPLPRLLSLLARNRPRQNLPLPRPLQRRSELQLRLAFLRPLRRRNLLFLRHHRKKRRRSLFRWITSSCNG